MIKTSQCSGSDAKLYGLEDNGCWPVIIMIEIMVMMRTMMMMRRRMTLNTILLINGEDEDATNNLFQ